MQLRATLFRGCLKKKKDNDSYKHKSEHMSHISFNVLINEETSKMLSAQRRITKTMRI